MKKELEKFVSSIENFDSLKSSDQLVYLAYFVSEKNEKGIKAGEITQCFNLLHLSPYSNISSFLSRKSSGKNKLFLKKRDGYYFTRSLAKEVEEKIGDKKLPEKVASDFFPIELLEDTRGYLKTVANQALASYNEGIYDGASILMRKLVEILIIECFEKHKVDSLIKKTDGSFFHLRDLIIEFLKEPKWNISRNAKKGLPKIKKVGDQSAHNRRYIARKMDLDSIKDELRIVVEELVHLIDYKSWNKK